MARQPVTVDLFYKEHAEALQMRLLTDKDGFKRIIREPTVNRPGLALSGFTRYFAYKRVQVMGNAEVTSVSVVTSPSPILMGESMSPYKPGFSAINPSGLIIRAVLNWAQLRAWLSCP